MKAFKLQMIKFLLKGLSILGLKETLNISVYSRRIAKEHISLHISFKSFKSFLNSNANQQANTFSKTDLKNPFFSQIKNQICKTKKGSYVRIQIQ